MHRKGNDIIRFPNATSHRCSPEEGKDSKDTITGFFFFFFPLSSRSHFSPGRWTHNLTWSGQWAPNWMARFQDLVIARKILGGIS